MNEKRIQNKISQSALDYYFESKYIKTDLPPSNVKDFIEHVVKQPPYKNDLQSEINTRYLCIDGPSGSGKNTLFSLFKRYNDHISLSILDTNVFMQPRHKRNDKENKSLFRNWYRSDFFKENLISFLNSEKEIIIKHAYKHDKVGDISHTYRIHPGQIKVLMGRYSLHSEIQSIFEKQLIRTEKIIIDAPQSLRLKRVKQRASIQKHRTPEEQEKLILDIVDPDWLKYFPQIFLTADWYVVNYSDSRSVYRKPQDCINRNHVWGAFANLHIQTDRIYRLIEIGKNGITSLHKHKNLNETYYHISG